MGETAAPSPEARSSALANNHIKKTQTNSTIVCVCACVRRYRSGSELQSQEGKSKEVDGRDGLRLSGIGEEHSKTEHNGGDCWRRRKEMLAKKTEQDTALKRLGFMLKREGGEKGMDKAEVLQRGQPGQSREGQESRTMGKAGMKRIG